jgi:hypothetical protein
MGSITTSVLQEETLHGGNPGVNKESYITGMPLYGVHKELSLTRMHVNLYGVN